MTAAPAPACHVPAVRAGDPAGSGALRALVLCCVARTDVRKVVVLGWSVVGGLALLGVVVFRRPTIEMLGAFDLRDMRLTVPSLVAGGLFAAAAVVGQAFQGPGRPGGPVALRVAAWLLALLGLDAVGRLHERAAFATGGAVAWASVAVVVGVAACALAATVVRGPPLWLLRAGAVEWAGAVLVGALAARGSSPDVGAQLLEIVAGLLVLIALLAAAQDHVRLGDVDVPGRSRTFAALRVLRGLDLRRVAIALMGCSAALLVLGWLVRVVGVPFDLADPHGELSFPAWFDATMLASAAGLALLLDRLDRRSTRRRRLTARVMAVVLMWMAVDELLSVHETIGGRVGLPGEGQILMAPLLLAAAVAWLLTLERLWPVSWSRTLWLAGAAVWLVSQAIDMVYGGLRAETAVSGVIEDALEGWGSSLFVLALLVAVQRSLEDRWTAIVLREAEATDTLRFVL